MSKRRERSYRTHSVVLKRRDHADADRLLTVFTPNDGKIELLAKGARKTSSRKAGHLELFSHSSLLVAKSRTWDIITEATTVESFRHIRENLDNFGHAAYTCELIDCFTQADDENKELWELLLLALRWLDLNSAGHGMVRENNFGGEKEVDEENTDNQATNNQGTFDVNLLMRWFELQLLAVNGFQPEFFRCLSSGEALKEENNYLSIGEGGVYSPEFGQHREDVEVIAPDVLKILRHLQTNSWIDVYKLIIRPQTMLRIENILYRLILVVLERQLKSVDFLRKLRRMK